MSQPLTESDLRRLRTFTAGWRGERRSADSLVVGLNPLATGTQIPVYWCLQGYRELANLARELPDHPVYGMRSGHLVLAHETAQTTALARRYADEVAAIHPGGTCLIGGNCQASRVAFELARTLVGQGVDVQKLVVLDPLRPEPYEGAVLPIYSASSITDPRRHYREPEKGWDRLCPGHEGLRWFDGPYGQSFDPGYVHSLARLVREAATDTSRGDSGPRAAPSPLSDDTRRAKITLLDSLPDPLVGGQQIPIRVRVQNLSAALWPDDALSVSNRWIRASADDDILDFCDAGVSLGALGSGQCTEAELLVTAPLTTCAAELNIDVVEEGVTWFQHMGSVPARVTTQVQLEPGQIEAAAPMAGRDTLDRPFDEALVAIAAHEWREAIRLLLGCHEQSPYEPRVLSELANAHFAVGDVAGAEMWVERGLDAEPDNPHLHFLRGDLLAGKVDIDRQLAIEAYQRSLDLGLPDAVALLRIMDCYLLDEDDTALDSNLLAQERASMYAELMALGRAFVRAADWPAAIEIFTQSAEFALGTDPLPYLGIAHCHWRRRSYVVARAYLKRAQARGGSSVRWRDVVSRP